VSARELAAAGIDQPLRPAFESARRIHAQHGRSYFLATRLLPAAKRPHVHALYGFARYVDDLVDRQAPNTAPALASTLDDVEASLMSGTDCSPVVAAVRETIRHYDLPVQHFHDFLASMRLDLTIASYPRYADLERYMWGSGAVIGLLLLPILGTTGSPAIAAPYAADLGIAFQLTNFIRDVGEDARRGRVYLPAEDLAEFGVDISRLRHGVVDGPVRALLTYEISRARGIYRNARQGIRLLAPSSRPCIEAAYRLYSGILDEIERADYQVLRQRVSVPIWRRALVAAPAVLATAYPYRS